MGIHHFWREHPPNNGTGLLILGQHYPSRSAAFGTGGTGGTGRTGASLFDALFTRPWPMVAPSTGCLRTPLEPPKREVEGASGGLGWLLEVQLFSDPGKKPREPFFGKTIFSGAATKKKGK